MGLLAQGRDRGAFHPPPPSSVGPRRPIADESVVRPGWGRALEGLRRVRNSLWVTEEGETHCRGMSTVAVGRPVRCVAERLEERRRWKSEWSPRHKVTRRSSLQRRRVRRGGGRDGYHWEGAHGGWSGPHNGAPGPSRCVLWLEDGAPTQRRRVRTRTAAQERLSRQLTVAALRAPGAVMGITKRKK
jgi:hypothetical protein